MNHKVVIRNLKCEYMVNPIGIDEPRPRLYWELYSEERNVMQRAYQIQVAKNTPCFETLVWDSGKVESDQSVHVIYQGDELNSSCRYYFRVMIWDNKGNPSDWSDTGFWEMGLLKTEEWIAEWITPSTEFEEGKHDACPLLRKSFEITSNVKTARIYATALGLYELTLNGSSVGDALFTPGWTSYNTRLQYQTYDVTELLKTGQNAIGAILGNGWYKGYLGWDGKKNLYGDKVALLFQMNIEYEDGNKETIVSDGSWKASSGAILMSELYHGETYDARLEKQGWDMPSYDDKDWNQVSVLEHTKEILVAQENVPVRRIQEIKPVGIIHTPKGETVIDFGQNMVGWVRFRVEGAKGDEVRLRHFEVLDQDGNVYVDNIRAAKQTIQYTLNGEAVECFEPHFSFQGFRYVWTEKYPGEIKLENFTGIVIHSDMDKTGVFTCSNELINQLQHNIQWGQKGNFLDVPTDCPQRDERLGWTGDAQVFARAACFNMNTAPFFKKWLRDVKADQADSGSVPHVVPNILDSHFGGSAACGWADAAVIVPWTLYLCYGDTRILQDQYESMKAYIEYIRSQSVKGLLWNSGFHFGDWLALDAKEGSYFGATPNDYTATAFYAYSTEILAKTAGILGDKVDESAYLKLHEEIVKEFQKEFVTPNGKLTTMTQTAHILALKFDLVEEKDRKRTVDTLVKLLEENNWHLSTGFLGTPYLCHVLSSNGYTEVAYKLLHTTEYPSWLYQVTKGATTVWEHWDGMKEDGSFWSADMNSFNHYAYGCIGDWLYQVSAGLDTDERMPGYKHILIEPNIKGTELTHARAEYESIYGKIVSGWRMLDNTIEVEVSVPANTTAELVLSGAQLDGLREGNQQIASVEGILNLRQETDKVVLTVGSGDYCFTYVCV